ncbi:E3 ubiquitin-protein ligase TRIM35-like [Vanacampus margaritifer]
MASRVEDDLKCPTCLEIFQDPVFLPCGHSFCRACVQQWWQEKRDGSCPACRKKCRSEDVPSNLALKNACETFKQASVESDNICILHQEERKLFCMDHQELACLNCTSTERHSGRTFCSINDNEMTKGHVKKLQESLQCAMKRQTEYKKIIDDWNEHATYTKKHRETAEIQIKKDFEEFRRFLQAEEAARLAALKDEKEQKSRRMQRRIDLLDNDIAALLATIRSTEEQLTSDPVPFMKNFQDAMNRIQRLPGRHERPRPGALLDEAKHVGNLKFRVWERMKELVS